MIRIGGEGWGRGNIFSSKKKVAPSKSCSSTSQPAATISSKAAPARSPTLRPEEDKPLEAIDFQKIVVAEEDPEPLDFAALSPAEEECPWPGDEVKLVTLTVAGFPSEWDVTTVKKTVAPNGGPLDFRML